MRLEKQRDQIDNDSDTKKTRREDVHDPHDESFLIEFVSAEHSEKQAQEKCCPFVFPVRL